MKAFHLLTSLRNRRSIHLANESIGGAVTLLLPNQFPPRDPGEEHWVQLSPFGDFGNTLGAARVIQRFRKEDAEKICNEFNSPLRRLTQPLGMPFYIGHPDHPRFAGQAGHEDTRAYGRGKEMQVRQENDCPGCASFANGAAGPCQEHGLYVRMQWNEDGLRLIGNESFHGHSVNWAATPDGMENGMKVFRPVRVKSAGFTNEPNIPVRPASLANEATSSDSENTPAQLIVPSRLKVLAGFKEDEEVTMDQVIEALENAKLVATGKQLQNERRARAGEAIDSLVKAGRVLVRDRAEYIEQLCNAGENFAGKVTELGNVTPAVKTQPRSAGLVGMHAKVVEGERGRATRLQELMDTRLREVPNESYDERFRAVANSNEGAHLFAQMRNAAE
jgi:hypothetical protein